MTTHEQCDQKVFNDFFLTHDYTANFRSQRRGDCAEISYMLRSLTGFK
jgi:hypothetical protein